MESVKLINPRSRNHPEDKLTIRETEHYFLALDQFSERLVQYIEDHLSHWRPNVTRFSQNIAQELRARPITRDIKWGIPVPLEGWDEKSLYVWFEAVMGYFTASVEWAKNIGQPEAWKKWWYNPDARIYNFLGKDNIPFHTIIWQAELMGVDGIYNENGDSEFAGKPLQLPYDVPANEFMNIEGKQFSKSRNWAIWLPDILERYQADAIRYYVIMTFPETADSDFSWDGFLSRVNNELLAAWGNLANRVLGFAYKRYAGKVPEYDVLTEADKEILAKIEGGFDEVGELLEAVKLRDALQTAMSLVRDVNGYLDSREPWKTIKVDEADAARSVHTALKAIDNLKIILAPFIPFSSQQLHEILGYDGQLFGELVICERQEDTRSHTTLEYDGSKAIGKWEKSNLPAGQTLRKPSPLFVKLEPEIVDLERQYLGQERIEEDIDI